MKEHFQTLINLRQHSLQFNSCNGYGEINRVLSQYTNVLHNLSSHSDHYKTVAKWYYHDITSIRDNIQRSVDATELSEKVHAFECAGSELKANIDALAYLVKPQQD
ncbi:hypothetical protein EXU57_13145 [Segetibacter sp. 3557_3]|uniref:hypothetical protein n=1 Tax=Segetibacter sp. 3557_3 TaxID=2547429 RepID=UPI0010592168|nr:hypothetical protein [Segetibacter sp. 3557_3]TDH25642.1 hypothetical protein EXU57_13145 [Segetibacter sp. 3557_3]